MRVDRGSAHLHLRRQPTRFTGAMLALVMHLLLLIQFSPSPLVSLDVSGSVNPADALPQIARLEPLQRRVTLHAHTGDTSNASTSPTLVDVWSPITLDANDVLPSAVGGGIVWSTPALLQPTSSTATATYDPSSSVPLPFIVVASGRTLRFYTPLPRTLAAVPVARSFTSQPLLVGPAASMAFAAQLTVSLCVCGLAVDAPSRPTLTNSSLTTKLYFTDPLGALNMVTLIQGRLSSGTPQLKAWMVGTEQSLARPELDRTGAASNANGTITTGPCPPCFGDVLAVNSSATPTTATAGLFYSPRSTVLRSVLADANSDGLLDFIVVRSSVTENVVSMTAANESTQSLASLGLEVLAYRNLGTQSNGSEAFQLMSDTTGASGTSTNGVDNDDTLLRSSVSGVPSALVAPSFPDAEPDEDADAVQNLFISARMRDGLRGTAASGVRDRLRPLSLPAGVMRPNYFAVTSLPTTTTTLPPIQMLRVPECVSLGQFDASGGLDLLIGVTEYLNQSVQVMSTTGVEATYYAGVLVRRRLVTLFATNSAPFQFSFDTTAGSGGVSNTLTSSTSFIPGASMISYTSTAAGAFSPLLSKVVSLESAWNSAQYSSSIPALSDNMVRSSSLPSSALVDVGFQPFPFGASVVPSSFSAAATSLQLFQQAEINLIQHSFTNDIGTVTSMRSDAAGQWSVGTTAVNQSVMTDGWDTSVAVSDDLAAMSAAITNPLAFMPVIETGPHPSGTLSPISLSVYGSVGYDLVVSSYFPSSTSSSTEVDPLVECSWQFYYAISTPAIISTLNVTAPDQDRGQPSKTILQYTLLQHDMQVAEYYRTGWTEGVRVNAVGIEMVKDGGGVTEWRTIVASPATWTILFLLFLILLFAAWMLYRRRERLFQQDHHHMLNEIRTVLELEQPQPHMDEPDDSGSVDIATITYAGQSTSSPPITSESVRSHIGPAAPPNTGLVDASPALVDEWPPLATMPDGVLLHRPRIEAPTAHGPPTAPADNTPHSAASDSPLAEEFVFVSPTPATANATTHETDAAPASQTPTDTSPRAQSPSAAERKDSS